MMRLIPNTITCIGHVLTIAWLVYPSLWYLAIIGLLCDVADGEIARRLGVATETGAHYDWAVDITIASIVAFRFHPLILIPLVALQARWRWEHFSGRTILVMIALVSHA